MRTTIRLDDRLLADAKKVAVDNGRSLTSLIEDALREVVLRHRFTKESKQTAKLLTFNGRGLRPGIDLDNSAALLDLMDDI